MAGTCTLHSTDSSEHTRGACSKIYSCLQYDLSVAEVLKY